MVKYGNWDSGRESKTQKGSTFLIRNFGNNELIHFPKWTGYISKKMGKEWDTYAKRTVNSKKTEKQ